jgi:hypothetical protein
MVISEKFLVSLLPVIPMVGARFRCCRVCADEESKKLLDQLSGSFFLGSVD